MLTGQRKENLFLAIVCVFIFQLFIAQVVAAKEEEYPERPIQFLIPMVPGGSMDLSGRAFSKIASKYLEKPLVVVNMPGAVQTVACNELAKSPADGHTIVMLATSYKSLTVHTQKIPLIWRYSNPF